MKWKVSKRALKSLPIRIWMGGHEVCLSVCPCVCLSLRRSWISFGGMKGSWWNFQELDFHSFKSYATFKSGLTHRPPPHHPSPTHIHGGGLFMPFFDTFHFTMFALFTLFGKDKFFCFFTLNLPTVPSPPKQFYKTNTKLIPPTNRFRQERNLSLLHLTWCLAKTEMFVLEKATIFKH